MVLENKRRCYWSVWPDYFNLVILSVGLATGVFLMVTRLINYMGGVDHPPENEGKTNETGKALLFRMAKDAALTLLVNLCMWGIWTTTRRLAATKNCDTTDAHKMATIWQNVSPDIQYPKKLSIAVVDDDNSEDNKNQWQGEQLKLADDSKVTLPKTGDMEVPLKLVVVLA